MKLQFLIPQYNETDKDIRPLLTSISIQQNIDFNEIGAIIVNDGSDVKLTEKFLKSFPFEIKYIFNEHKGVSAARNRALDEASAEYVMFCDADDMFYNMCGLNLIFEQINNGGFDVFLSYFMEETRTPEGTPVYVEHQQDATFVHGKVYKKSFLELFQIRWQEQFTIHEDSYFNYLCQACARSGQMKLCRVPFYLWKWNDQSVSRHDPKYILKTFNCLLDSSTQLVKDLIGKGLIKNAQYVVTGLIYNAYFTLNKTEWLEQENQDYRYAVEKRFKKYYLDFKKLYDTIDENSKNQIIISLKNQKYREGMIMEKITFDDWIRKIEQYK